MNTHFCFLSTYPVFQTQQVLSTYEFIQKKGLVSISMCRCDQEIVSFELTTMTLVFLLLEAFLKAFFNQPTTFLRVENKQTKSFKSLCDFLWSKGRLSAFSLFEWWVSTRYIGCFPTLYNSSFQCGFSFQFLKKLSLEMKTTIFFGWKAALLLPLLFPFSPLITEWLFFCMVQRLSSFRKNAQFALSWDVDLSSLWRTPFKTQGSYLQMRQ